MPRTARKKSKSGIYHVMMRGINRQKIFLEEDDNIKFIETLKKYKEISGYDLFGYCLMGNHLHLLMKENKESLGTTIQRICSSYVLWYNKKYDRIGHLFQERFKSEPVEDDTYFLVVLRYILQNPVKAGIVSKAQDYEWSNCKDFIDKNGSTDTDFVLGLFHPDKEKGSASFIEFVNMTDDDTLPKLRDTKKVSDTEAVEIIKSKWKINYPPKIQELENNQRNACLKELKETCGLSIRQIERLTGIGRGIIQKI